MPQTLESSLLYTREDGSPNFVHDIYRDFFLARWFADRINDGKIRVEKTWKKYWSYEEDAELWDLPKDREWRSLLPAMEQVMAYVGRMLEIQKIKELIQVLDDSYFAADAVADPNDYNPFERDNLMVNAIVGYYPDEREAIEGYLNKRIKPSRNPYKDQFVLDIGCFGRYKEILKNTDIQLQELKAGHKLEFDPKMFGALGNSGDEYVFNVFCDILPEAMKKFHTRIDLKNGKTCGTGPDGKYDESTMWVSFYHIVGIGKCGKEKAVGILGQLSRSSNGWIRHCATRALSLTNSIDAEKYLLERREDENEDTRLFALGGLLLIGSDVSLQSIEELLDHKEGNIFAPSYLARRGGRQELELLLSKGYRSNRIFHYPIYEIHHCLKPRDYNPPIKKLSA